MSEGTMRVIAIDYDGCIAINSWPGVGEPNWAVIDRAKAEQARGSKLILWTCREDEKLKEALDACEKWGLRFDSVNESMPEWIEDWGTAPRKIGATEYWDDRAVRMSGHSDNLLIDRLRCIAAKGPNLTVLCSKRTLEEAADAMESLTAELQSVITKLHETESELVEERYRHDRLQDFEVAESKQLEKAVALLKEWEKYRQDLMFIGRISLPAKWEGR